MTLITEEGTTMLEIEEKSFDKTNFFDCSRFFMPAECIISEKKIAW